MNKLVIILSFNICLGATILGSHSSSVAPQDDFLLHMAGLAEAGEHDANQLIDVIKRSNSIPRIAALLRETGGPNVKDSAGWTPLMWAVKLNKPEVVDFLLAQGANVETSSNVGASGFDKEDAISLAIKLNHFAIAKKLLRAGKLHLRLHGGGDPNNWAPENVKIHNDGSVYYEISDKMKDLLYSFDLFDLLSENVDKEISQEPKIEQYFIDGSSFEQDEEALNKFHSDLQDYVLSKLKMGLRAYLYEDNARPLIEFFNMLFDKPGFTLILSNFLDRAEDFCLSCLIKKFGNEVKDKMTPEERVKLDHLVGMISHESTAAIDIQKAWRAYVSSPNRQANREAYKKRMDMMQLPFADADVQDV